MKITVEFEINDFDGGIRIGNTEYIIKPITNKDYKSYKFRLLKWPEMLSYGIFKTKEHAIKYVFKTIFTAKIVNFSD